MQPTATANTNGRVGTGVPSAPQIGPVSKRNENKSAVVYDFEEGHTEEQETN